jgi:hypothetical protein
MSDAQPESVGVYQKANVANIIKKLKAGRTLTTAERKAVDDYESQQGGNWAKDLSSLARELGLSRQAIYEARSRFPNDAPKKHADGKRENIEAWREFCAAKLIGRDTATKTLADLKAELMQREIKLRDMKIARESGKVIDSQIVDDMLMTLAQKLDLLLRLKLEVELGPRVAGKTPAEANLEGRLILDEIREVVNANISTFQTEAITQTIRQDDDADGTDGHPQS